MNVKEEKNAKTTIVRFETSTSPSWKDIKMFISYIFLKINIITKTFFNTIYKLKRITIPKIILQITNNFKPFEEKYFNKKSIANKEDKNVEIRPKTKGAKLNSDN